MTLSYAKQVAVTLLAGLILSVAPAYAGTSRVESDLAQLSRELDKVGQNLCKSLDLKCQKSKRAARKKAPARSATEAAASSKSKKPSPSPVAKPKPVEVSAAAAPKAPYLAPIPRQKPSTLAGKPPEAAPASIPPPLPKALASKSPEAAPAPIPPLPKALASKPPIAAPAPIPPPLPRAKPPPVVALLPAAPAQKPVVVSPETAIAGEECLAALRTSKLEFETVATPVSNGPCQVNMPVRLLAVPTRLGRVVLPDKPTFNCRFARQFAQWLSDAGAAVVTAQMNTTLTRVSTGPGYECRGRNGDITAKLSEHAFGNAVDITTLSTADGRTIQVSDAVVTTSPDYQLLRGLRTTACGYFSTVLGPGSNAAHATHFHFDMGLHGKSAAYRVCQ
jgi:hypothetical protein